MIFTKSPNKWYKIHRHIMHHIRDLHCAWQRANKGYCYRDLSDIDNWFFETFPRMLEDFKAISSGTPIIDTKLNSQENEALWNKILNEMIFLCDEQDSDKCSWQNKYKFDYKNLGINSDWFKEENKIYNYQQNCQNMFFNILKKHIRNLWD